MQPSDSHSSAAPPSEQRPEPARSEDAAPAAREIGGRPGPDPTRYGDWEKNGRCVDF